LSPLAIPLAALSLSLLAARTLSGSRP
jgi:hypothetical protein